MSFRLCHREAVAEAPEDEQQEVGSGSLDLRRDVRKMGENQASHEEECILCRRHCRMNVEAAMEAH